MEAEGGIGGGNSWAAPTWAVRIRRGDGTIAGAGVLVDPGWVLTHAGAVAEREHVTAEFVGAGGASRRAVADQVCAVDAGGVALLRLDLPGPARAARPLRRLSVPHRDVRVYGFPTPEGTGRWLAASTEPDAGTLDGRVRLALTERPPADHVAAGVDGAGVADAATGELVGVALPGPVSGGRAVPCMSPAETIVRHLPSVADWTRGWAAVDERLRVGREGEPGVLDPHFARRLAEWFRGGPPGRTARGTEPVTGSRALRHHRDSRQVKISQIRSDGSVRAATLRRALLLADRELRGPVAMSPETDPSPDGLDLAVDATGRPTLWVAERVADRLGVLVEGPEDIGAAGPDLPVRRILAASTTLTLVVVGVDQAADPGTLLDLLAHLRTHGDRMLLVFRHDGAHFARAQSQLVIEPSQQRQARLVGRLTVITGPLAAGLHERMSVVRGDCDRALDALVKAHAVLTTVAGTAGVVAGLGPDPDLGRFERVADRAERRIKEAVDLLDPLIERRAQLIGRLDSYQVLHQEAVDSEDLAAEDLYLAAHVLLHARPCDLTAAEAAMAEYAGFVERWSSRHDEGRQPRPDTGDGAGPAAAPGPRPEETGASGPGAGRAEGRERPEGRERGQGRGQGQDQGPERAHRRDPENVPRPDPEEGGPPS